MDNVSICVLYLCNVLHEFQESITRYEIKRSRIVIIF